ncbi:MAG: phosphoenolpyruvate--protein phosphotransferase [Deltaproteobacteria bacterium]|nr:phosphoenolpyruvate--protein phosphotransferase [Deltaproteobacteria bacterium]
MKAEDMSVNSFPAQIASSGIVMGKALMMNQETLDELLSEVSDLDHFRKAIMTSKFQLQELALSRGNTEANILKFQLSLLEDAELIDPVIKSISDKETCSRAWQKRLDSMIEEFEEESDSYFKARAEDLKDLKQRVLKNLSKKNEIPPNPFERSDGPEKCIVLADEMTPSQFIETDWNQHVGIVLNKCSHNSHVAILARSYGIPMLTDLEVPLSRMTSNTPLILDGNKGRLIVDPSPQEMEEYQEIVQKFGEEKQLKETYLKNPSQTLDGERVLVKINSDSQELLNQLNPEHCDGIGLTRTEFLIQDGRLPDEEEQFQIYSQLIKWASGKPVTIRTLDAGGDKPVEGVTMDEQNPFLGFRGVRISLEFQNLFRSQLRALIRAAVLGPVQVMVPMVTVAEEIDAVKKILNEEFSKLQQKNISTEMPKLGMMVEVPLAALEIETFDVDFYSIGSNDLIQYLTATARDNPTVSHLYHANYPALWDLISRVAAHGRKTGREVSVCGDIASNTDYLEKLMKSGIRSISVSPASLADVKTFLASLSLNGCSDSMSSNSGELI